MNSEKVLNTIVMITKDDECSVWLMHEVELKNRDYSIKYFRSEFADGSGSAIDIRNPLSMIVYSNSICIGDL